MRLRRIIQIILTFSLFMFTACYGSWNFFYDGNNVDKRIENFKQLDNSDPRFAASHISSLKNKYNVLIISDTHFGNTKKEVNCEILYKYLASIKGTSQFPAFAICLGDSTDIGTREQFEQYNHFCNTLMNNYGISIVLNACGNHDIYQNNYDNWKENCYPHTTFYKFQTNKISWYCLDTASGTIGENQYNKLMQLFENDSRPKIIFTHYPFTRFNYDCSNMAETTERNKLLSDFARNNVICVFGGHNHTQTYDNLGYPDYGIPSFAYDEAWAMLHVDENARTAEIEFIP